MNCNIDEAAHGALSLAASGDLFHDRVVAFVGCFTHYLGVESANYAKLLGAIVGTEIVVEKGCHSLWIESDYVLVIQAFSNYHVVLWHLHNRRQNMLYR